MERLTSDEDKHVMFDLVPDDAIDPLAAMPVYDESAELLKGLHRQYHTLLHEPQSDEEDDDEEDEEDDEGGLFSSLWACAPHAPAPSWPASFKKSAALLVRHAPTQMSEERSGMVTMMTIGSPEFRRKPSFWSNKPPVEERRMRGYSDDAPVLRLKLPLFDAKLSDTSWLTDRAKGKKKKKKQTKKKTASASDVTAATAADNDEVFHNHPTVRKFRDQYSNWRKGAAKGASGELTNDRLDGYTVGGEEAEVNDEVELPEEQIKQIEDKIEGKTTHSLSNPLPLSTPFQVAEIPPYVPSDKQYDEYGYPSITRSATMTRKDGTQVATDGSTLFQTFLNGMNAMLGLGLLSMPFVMYEIGLLFIPILLMIALIAVHTLDLLDRCQIRTGSLSFPDVATAAFGTSGRWFAASMCYFDLYAAGVGCMIITAHSLDMIVFALTGYLMGDAKSKIITAIAYVPTCFLKDLSVVSYLSMGGLVANIFTVGLVLTFIGTVTMLIGEGYGDDVKAVENGENSPSGSKRTWFGFVSLHMEKESELVGPNPFIPVSLILYQFCMHSLYPSLRASMARPTEAPLMSRLVLAIVAILVTVFSTFIYVVLGAEVPEIITSELGTSLMGIAVNVMVLLNSYSKFPLTLFPVCDAVIELLPEDHESKDAKTLKMSPHQQRYMELEAQQGAQKEERDAHGNVKSKRVTSMKQTVSVRVSALVTTLFTCVFITGFASIIGLCSWIFAPSLVLAIPFACYLRIFGDEIDESSQMMYKCGITISCIASVVGTILNVYYF